ncbi:MAG TPA: TraR/DksA C4-type zinc finger protein [Alphaproteobacteria bacterium]
MDGTAYEQRLRAELAALVAASEQGKEDRGPVTLDQQSVGRLSRMDAMQIQAMAVATEDRRQARIRALRAALARLAVGEFGYCLSCGGAIPAKRLDLDPALATCVACARGRR